MRAPRVLVAMLAVPMLVLTGCGGVPKVAPQTSASPGAVVPTVGPGTILTDALTEAHCVRGSADRWSANGTIKNTTKQTRTLDVHIYVGPADGDAGVAQVVTVKKLAAGDSAAWKAAAIQASSPTGPCYIRVRVAK